MPTRRMWLAFLGAVVLTASTATTIASTVHDRAQAVRADCRTAFGTEDVFSEANRELTDGRRIGTGGAANKHLSDWGQKAWRA
ncbi:hypothetical protein E3G70_000809 [Mycobacteroides abscessus]|nr:hypothetical protein E3G70_000809 [Mycobacteroides abscessus]